MKQEDTSLYGNEYTLNENESENEEDAVARRLWAFYEALQRRGTEFLVDGDITRLQELQQGVLREDSVYMADYVTDERGEIVQVRFDRVDTD